MLPGSAGLDDIVGCGRGVVPSGLRSDGEWVWSEAALFYLGRYGVAIDPGLAAHAAVAPVAGVLSHLDRHRVRVALSTGAEGAWARSA